MEKKLVNKFPNSLKLTGRFKKKTKENSQVFAKNKSLSSSTSLNQKDNSIKRIEQRNDILYINYKYFDNLHRRNKKKIVPKQTEFLSQNKKNFKMMKFTSNKIFPFSICSNFMSQLVKFHRDKQIVLFNCIFEIKLLKFDLNLQSHIFQRVVQCSNKEQSFFLSCDFLKGKFQDVIVTCKANGCVEIYDYEQCQILDQIFVPNSIKVFGSEEGFFLVNHDKTVKFFDFKYLYKDLFNFQINEINDINTINDIQIIDNKIFIQTLKDTFIKDLQSDIELLSVDSQIINLQSIKIKQVYKCQNGYILIQNFQKVFYVNFEYQNYQKVFLVEEEFYIQQYQYCNQHVAFLCGNEIEQYILIYNSQDLSAKSTKIQLPKKQSFTSFGFIGNYDSILVYQKTEFFIVQINQNMIQIFLNQIINEL